MTFGHYLALGQVVMGQKMAQYFISTHCWHPYSLSPSCLFFYAPHHCSHRLESADQQNWIAWTSIAFVAAFEFSVSFIIISHKHSSSRRIETHRSCRYFVQGSPRSKSCRCLQRPKHSLKPYFACLIVELHLGLGCLQSHSLDYPCHCSCEMAQRRRDFIVFP